MPPRFAYWTILIDNAPTAFRAREAEELLPTLNQLRRKNANAEMRWFARGKLWESREEEHEDFKRQKYGATGAPGAGRPRGESEEKRNRDWRPGGNHKDPRARFDKEKRRRDKREQRSEREQHFDRARQAKEGQSDRPTGDRPPRRDGDRPWQAKPWSKDRPFKPKSDRPWSNRPPGDRPRSDRPPGDRPPRRDGDRPWQAKPWSKDRPFKPKSDRPWSDRPPGDRPPSDRPRSDRPPRRDDAGARSKKPGPKS